MCLKPPTPPSSPTAAATMATVMTKSAHNGAYTTCDAPASALLTSTPAPPPAPRIASSTILTAGLVVFILASITTTATGGFTLESAPNHPYLILIAAAILSRFIPYACRINDDGESRRKLWKAFFERNDLPEELRCKDVDLEERYWVNDRGMCLLTSIMLPKDGAPIHAVLCFCHGYMDSTSFMKRIEYQRFVQAGIAVAMIDFEGHGRSDGTNCLLPDWDALVGDADAYFSEIAKSSRFAGKKVFLMGESMGGSVVFDLITRYNDRRKYAGAVLACPMCKVADDALPSPWVVKAFQFIAGPPGSMNLFSAMPVAPNKSIPERSFKMKEKMNLSSWNPSSYGRKARLATGRELLNTTKRISKSFHLLDSPFLVLHGLSDYVTCPKMSEDLYRGAPSKDKGIKLYPGMFHNLTCGDTYENTEMVFDDAISWVLKRV